MNIAIRGGGPGGLYAAILFRRLGHDVTVWERNAPDDTFGFGVVFSDETLAAFEAADALTYAAITRSFARWGEIDIFYRGGTANFRRPRILCAEPQAAAQHPPGSGV